MDNDSWSQRLLLLLAAVCAVSPESFMEINSLSGKLTYAFVAKHATSKDVEKYLKILPGYMANEEVAKRSHEQLRVMLEATLQNWLLIFEPEKADVKPPVTADILLRCIEQKVEWPNEWLNWFKQTHG